MLVIYIVIGVLIGFIGAAITDRKRHVGFLRVDASDPDSPYLFLELKKNIAEITTQKRIILEVKCENFIPHK